MTGRFRARLAVVLGDVSTKAVKIQEKALFSIYLIEWFTVTGTAMLSAFILYTLMMKRRYYREVKLTRARQARE